MKKQTNPPITEDQFSDAQKTFCEASNVHSRLAARMQEKIDKVRAEYTDELRACNKVKEEAEATIQRYCEENRDSLLTGDRRSFKTDLGTCAFKSTPPSLIVCAPLTWDNAVASLKEAKLKAYVRVEEMADKAAIKTALGNASGKDSAALAGLGFDLERKEKITFTPHTEQAAA